MSVNCVMLLGRMGHNPELRYTDGNLPVCKFSLATNHRTNGQDHTEWHKIVAFGKTAEAIDKSFAKGSQIFVQGKICTRKYQTKAGENRQATEIVLDRFSFVGSKAESAGREANGYQPDEQDVVTDEPASEPGEVSFDDDDIPF